MPGGSRPIASPQPGAAPQPGSIWDAISSAYGDLNRGAQAATSAIAGETARLDPFASSPSPAASEPANKPAAKGKTKAATAAPAAPDRSFENLADAQANQYLAMTKALDPLTSGAALPGIDAAMSGNAETMLGASATSPVASWLNAQTQAAQAQGAGVTAAGAQVGKAEDANSALIAGGLKDMGVAEQDLMRAAPYQQLLSSLAASVPYHLASGYSIPGFTTANQPEWLQQAEKNAGVTPTPASGGSTAAAQGLLPAPNAQVASPPAPTTVPSGSATPQG